LLSAKEYGTQNLKGIVKLVGTLLKDKLRQYHLGNAMNKHEVLLPLLADKETKSSKNKCKVL
jgi:hypothetical protein